MKRRKVRVKTLYGKYQNKRQKLTEEEKIQIVNMYETGEYSKSQLGQQFGVSSSWIGKIVSSRLD